jgi:hypothetical protein
VLGQLLANLAVEMAKLHTKSRLQYIEISQVRVPVTQYYWSVLIYYLEQRVPVYGPAVGSV